VTGPIEVIGVPFNSNGHTDGVARGPEALRRAGVVAALSLAAPTTDTGDVDFATPEPHRSPASGLLAEDALVSMVDAVETRVRAAFAAGRFPVLVGGDCPIVLGALAAVRRRHGRAGLLFVDGHEDAWPPLRSLSGEAADSELGLALGLGTEGLPPALARHLPLVDPADVAVLGPRDARELADHGIDGLADGGVELHPAAELQEQPAATTVAAARRVAAAGAWWLHLDLDVLSTEAMASVDYPQDGGLDWDELVEVVVAAFSQPGCVGWSIAIYNPDLDPTGSDARRITDFVRVVARAIAGRRSGPGEG